MYYLSVSLFTIIFIGILTQKSISKSNFSLKQKKLNHKSLKNKIENKINQFDTILLSSVNISNQIDKTIENNAFKLTPNLSRGLLVLCCLVYGSSYTTTKYLQMNIKSSLVTTLRFFIGSIYFIPEIFKRRIIDIPLDLLLKSIEIGIWCSIGYLSQAISLDFASSSKVSLFSSLSVIIPPIFDYLINLKNSQTKTKIKHKKQSLLSQLYYSPFISPLLALFGAIILEFGSEIIDINDIYLIITPITFALTFYRSENLAIIYPNETLFITAIMLITVTIISFIISILTLKSFTFYTLKIIFQQIFNNKILLFSLLFTGLITTALTSVIEQYSLRYITAADTTLIYTIEPIIATIFGYIVLNEHITKNSLIGALFITIAFIWDNLRNKTIIEKIKI